MSSAFRLDPSKNIIPAPRDPAQWPAFRAQLTAWRETTRAALAYDASLYERPEFAWASSSYACYFQMIYDERFYDVANRRYRLDEILAEGVREFGGYDSLVLWHAYPRIGVDQRNQFDHYRDMPGGLPGVRDLVRGLHARGVKVYINYNPWDTSTRREGRPDADLLAEIVGAIEADGIFLDCMTHGGAEFRAKLDAVRPGVILEGEGTPPQAQIADHHASWAQWFDDSEVPGVLRHKWFERRHLQHQTQRWNTDHSAEIHTAWINGSGIMIWENVFGAWVPYHERDRSLLRAMLPIQRRFTALFSGEGWTPLVPVEQPDTYASLWTDGAARLWTLVNRTARTVAGPLIAVPVAPGERTFDLIAGHELYPTIHDGLATLSATLPPRGLGGLLALPAAQVTPDFEGFLAAQAATHARANYDTTTPR
ncbi:MAG: hypothetical protein H7067_20190, partial [Burkholderiales bacterium]|nr:hypothetical protein [Opitutaceae bacterium]